MKQNKQIPIALVAVFLVGCAAIQSGNDPLVVNAERTTQLALDTFNTIEKTEFEAYPAIKAANPKLAADLRNFVNNLRAHQYEWLSTARTMTKSYKTNRTAENKANLQTAVAVLTSAVNEAVQYLSKIESTKGAP